MKPSPSSPDEDLVDRYLRGEASAVDVQVLEQQLLNDPAARAEFRRTARLEINLYELAAAAIGDAKAWPEFISGRPDVGSIAEAPRRNDGRRWIAVALALAAMVAVVFWLTPGFLPPPPTESRYVATLLAGSGWQGPADIRFTAGTRLPVGPVRLSEGIAKFKLDSGVTLDVEAPAEFRLIEAGQIELTKGKLFIHGGATSESFELRTPRSILRTVASEYAIKVQADGDDLHVFSGSVRRISPSNPGLTEHCPPGEARRFARVDASGIVIPIDSGMERPVPAGIVAKSQDSLLAWEPFEYRGSIATGTDRTGGRGWSGAWLPAEGLSDVGFDEGQSLRPSAGAGNDGSIRTAGRAAMHRRLAHPLRLDEDGVYYFSYLFRRNTSGVEHMNMLMFVLRESGRSVEEEIARRSAMKVSIVSPNAVVAIHSIRPTVRAAVPLMSEMPYLLVGKIVARANLPDQVFVWIYAANENAPSSEAGDWLLATEPFRSDLVLDQVSLEFDAEGEIGFDELKLGTTWSSVTP